MRTPYSLAKHGLPLALVALVVAAVLFTRPIIGQATRYKVLILQNKPQQEQYHKESVAKAIEVITQLGAQNNFDVVATSNLANFNTANLSQYRTVIFLSPEAQKFTAEQEAAFQSYVENGGGFMGIHGAIYTERTTNTDPGWPWYRQVIGVTPVNPTPSKPGSEPDDPVLNAVTDIVDRTHPSTKNLPSGRWQRDDEWYNFDKTKVNPNLKLLIKVDEATIAQNNPDNFKPMGDPHPVTWYQTIENGRAWVTSMGHTAASFDDPNFQAMLLGAIQWSAGVSADQPSPSGSAQPSPSGSAQPSPSSSASPQPSPSGSPAPSASPRPRPAPNERFIPRVDK